jgi:hypothetical protein
MIQYLKHLSQRKQSRLPTVPEFLRNGVQRGDILVLNRFGQTEFTERGLYKNHPIETTDFGNFSERGWYLFSRNGCKLSTHIIRIERNGKVVAKGQEYND